MSGEADMVCIIHIKVTMSIISGKNLRPLALSRRDELAFPNAAIFRDSFQFGDHASPRQTRPNLVAIASLISCNLAFLRKSKSGVV